jgi:hypothetical protein
MKIGLERPVMPLVRLLLLPAAGLAAARLSAMLALNALPGLGLIGQLVVASGVSAAAFAAVLLIFAPRRVVVMANRLRRALIGQVTAEGSFL